MRRADLDPSSQKALVSYLEAQPDVAAAWVFGSRARGEARPDSDLDVAILAEDGWEHRPDALARTLCWRADLPLAIGWPPRAVDTVVCQDLHPLVAFSVVRDGILILDRDARSRGAWQLRALHRGMDARRLSRLSWEARLKRLRGEPV